MALIQPFQRWRRKWRSQRDWSLRDALWLEVLTGIRGQMYLDRGGGAADTVFLAGTARSGTSWLSEVINHDNGFRMIHEPMRRGRLRATRAFRPRHYLRPDDGDPEYAAAMRKVVEGRIRSIWTDKYNRKVLPSRRLIREVRANLLLPWIHSLFPEMPMILLLRHPCAVASSQVKWGKEWRVHLDRFLAEPALMEDLLEPFRKEIGSARTDFDQHVLGWCIENYVPLRQIGREQVHVVFYENLCMRPDSELGAVLGFIGRDLTAAALTRLGKPSNSTRKDSAIVSGDDLVESWRKDVSGHQVHRAIEILSLFGLDRIYGEGSMPLLSDPQEALAVR